MKEFALIQQYFSHLTPAHPDVQLGIGDDAAIVAPLNGMRLAMTLDTLVAGRHFFSDVDPESLGHKALAVNLSDLAAMGAQPAWALLSLTLPEIDTAWLQAFCNGLQAEAQRHAVQLIGGDTTQGPLSISIQLTGYLPAQGGLQRSGARPGDGIYVTGTLGDAALALLRIRQAQPLTEDLRRALERPCPRVYEGLALRERASACIDLSDGLQGDLGHLCVASGCGACVEVAKIPLSAPVRQYVQAEGDWGLVVSGGDDYELCFTLPAIHEPWLQRLALNCHRIGVITETPGVLFYDECGKRLDLPPAYEHFSKP